VLAALARIGHAFDVDETLDEAMARLRHIDVRNGPVPEVLRQIVDACDCAEDEDQLCWTGTLVIEVFLDLRGPEVWTPFEEAMRSSTNLRKAYTCSDHSLPVEVSRRFDALVDPDSEDVGGSMPGRFGPKTTP